MLKRIYRYGLLFGALAILMLHSLVPHQHHSSPLLEPQISNCSPTDYGLLGFLGKVFHQDLGEEHLEHFKHKNKLDFDADTILFLPAINQEVLAILPVKVVALTPTVGSLITPQSITGPPLLRGPPSS